MDSGLMRIRISDNADTNSIEKIFENAGWSLQSICIIGEELFAIFESGAE
jgi:hypothetical protein